MQPKTSIIGAGPAGLLCALDLHLANIPVTLIGPVAKPCPSMVLAIHPKNIEYLRTIGINPPATLVKRMQLNAYQNPICIRSENQPQEALCYIIEYDALLSQLIKQLQTLGVRWHQNTGQVLNNHTIAVGEQTHHHDALIICDGPHSHSKKFTQINSQSYSYQQMATTAFLTHTSPLRHAYQKFTSTGTLALLPTENAHRSALIWSADNAYSRLIDTVGLTTLLRKQTQQLGKVIHVEHQTQVPLSCSMADRFYSGNSYLLGSALHSIHPLAGIGFNLTIRDIHCLVKMLSQNLDGQYYTNQRKHAHTKAHLLTHYLADYRALGIKIANQNMISSLFNHHWCQSILLKQIDDICLD